VFANRSPYNEYDRRGSNDVRPFFFAHPDRLESDKGEGRGLIIQLVSSAKDDIPILDQIGSSTSKIIFGVLKEAEAPEDSQALLNERRQVLRFHLTGDLVRTVNLMTYRLRETFPSEVTSKVLACMDARLTVSKLLGLKTGEAHIIRNAGGIATEDAIRSLIISNELLGTKEFVVINHTDCGMLTFKDNELAERLAKKYAPARSMELSSTFVFIV
jgi:hypothetical protein